MNGNSKYASGMDSIDRRNVIALVERAEKLLGQLRAKVEEGPLTRGGWAEVRSTTRSAYACLTNVLIIIRQKNLDYLQEDTHEPEPDPT